MKKQLLIAATLLTGGLAPQPITVDQVKSLRQDNIVADGAKSFESKWSFHSCARTGNGSFAALAQRLEWRSGA